MKPLTANLMTLYQYPHIWINHFFLILGILIMTAATYNFFTTAPPFMGIPLFFFLIYGAAIGYIVADISSKPFGFCLPGQIKTAQEMLLLVWLSIMTIISLLTVVLSLMDIRSEYIHFLGSIGLMSLCYWVGVTSIIPKARFIAILFFFFLIFITPFSFFYGIKIIEPLLLAHPWEPLFLGGILSYLIYRAVGRRENFRHLVAMPWVGIFTSSKANQNIFKQERMRINQDQKPHRLTELTGNFFAERIRSQHNSLLTAHLLGQVYLMIGPLITHWRVTLLQSLLFSILICLFLIIPPQDLVSFIFHLPIFIFACLFCSIIFEYHRFNLFLLIDRKGHFWRGIVFLFTTILIVLVFMAALFLLFNLLSGSLLPLMFEGKSFIHPIKWILLIVPIIMIPLFGGLVILFKKTILIISLIIMFFIAVAISYNAVIAMENTPFIVDLLIVLSVIAITWGFHLAALYYDNTKRSLC